MCSLGLLGGIRGDRAVTLKLCTCDVFLSVISRSSIYQFSFNIDIVPLLLFMLSLRSWLSLGKGPSRLDFPSLPIVSVGTESALIVKYTYTSRPPPKALVRETLKFGSRVRIAPCGYFCMRPETRLH